MQAKDIFNIEATTDFEKNTLSVFKHQAKHNLVYKQFLSFLNTDIKAIKSSNQIPFLPIQFFKSHKIISTTSDAQFVFSSSGTTGNLTSKHYVTDIFLYEKSWNN